MHRSRGFAVPALAACLLTAVVGCSGRSADAAPGPSGGTRTGTASPSATPSPSPTPSPTPSASPSPTPTPTPTPTCKATADMDEAARAAYLKGLEGQTYAQKHGLAAEYDGVYFHPDALHRPCEAQKVSVARFWVVMTNKVNRDPATGRTFGLLYSYEPIEDREFTFGPDNGFLEGSRPPDVGACRGTITVLHLGEPVEDKALPDRLNVDDSTLGFRGTEVEVSGDLVLYAVFMPPTTTANCPA
ncbi:hypothetical protein ACFXAO_25375 [Streptomyces lavendulae]|uniref:hypothetical protein n=1 Tax=Streptomyces lavendulae TaxID=1914 RepID=UPI00368B59EA